jgi:hypothetical protein
VFFRGVVILDWPNDIHQHSLCTKLQEVNVFVLKRIISRLVELRFFCGIFILR